MPLHTCECVAGQTIEEKLTSIYCGIYTLAQGDADGPYLLKSANLSDVDDPAAARANLDAAASGANTDITSLRGITSGGAVGAPSITVGDATTGFWRDGAGLSISRNGEQVGLFYGDGVNRTFLVPANFAASAYLNTGDGTSALNVSVSGQLSLRTSNIDRLVLTSSVVAAFVPVRLMGYTVATLPAGSVGDTAYVTDATAPTYRGALVGGGAVTVPVFFNGAAWVSA